MSQERDTHFAGWAKLQIQKLQGEGLLEAWNPDFGEIDLEKVQRATQILTQGAYDLVAHTIYHINPAHLDMLAYEEIPPRIPDMTEWPKVEGVN